MLVYASQRCCKLVALTPVLRALIFYFPFAIIVLFSHELRRALAAFGRTPFFALFSGYHAEETISEIVLAVTSLSARRVGALVVLERREGLKTYIENGSPIDSAVSYELLVTLFAPGTPLHDGAVIVSARPDRRGGELPAAFAQGGPAEALRNAPPRGDRDHRGDGRARDPGLGGARHDLPRPRRRAPSRTWTRKSLRDLLLREFAAQ